MSTDLSKNHLKSNSQMWDTIAFYWAQNPPDSAHIRSYNDFIAKIPKLLNKTIRFGKFSVKMSDPKFIEPYTSFNGKRVKQYPSNCLNLKSSYESEVTCKFTFMFDGKVIKEEEGITIGSIPVLVGSNLCNMTDNEPPNDINLPPERQKDTTKRWIELMKMEFKTGLGGWFCKEGTSRIITFQERNKFNHPMIIDQSENQSKNKKYNYIVEVRNSVTDDNTTTILAACINKSGNIVCTMKYLDDKKEILPMLFFYALGFTDPAEIISFIVAEDDPLFGLSWVKTQIQKMFEQVEGVSWEEELSNLGMNSVDNKSEYIETILRKKFLHHYPTKKGKAIYLGFILYCLISISVPTEIKKRHPNINFVKEDDRDHFGDKVLNTESGLFCNVFYSAVRKMTETMEKAVIGTFKDKEDKVAETIVRDMNSKMLFPESDIAKMPITALLSKALTNNMWGNVKHDGVSTLYDPINYNNAVVLLMRSCIPLKSGKLDPRMVHGSYFGVVDLFDTPEGETIGYNKVLSSSCYISSEIDITNVKKYIKSQIKSLEQIEKMTINDYRIFIDNEWIGVATEKVSKKVYDKLVYDKRNGHIDATISIVIKNKELHIYAQEGRLMRPYLIVQNGEILLKADDYKNYETWESFLGSGKIEMLDCNEYEWIKLHCLQINDFVQLDYKSRCEYSHVDIHPATMFGPGAGSITYPQMTQGPRNSYGANQARQSVGTTARFDTPRKLFYPQRTLVRNKIASLLLHYDEYPAGTNVQVALMPSQGFEQEDGYTINQRFLEMGGFMTGKYTKHIIMIDGDEEKLEVPVESECFKFRPKDIRNIDPATGVIRKNSQVYPNDPLVCKIVLEINGNFKKTDTTIFYSEDSICWVDDVIIKEKGFRNSKMVKIVLRETRLTKEGNKFAPRSAQKGTVTYICPHEDMPFDPITNTTITIIVNPLCIPSRMTINYLYELFLGEYVCLPDKKSIEAGKKGVYNHPGYENCTPYDEDPVVQYKRVERELIRMGYRPDGCKELIDGRSGQTITTPIFCGHVHIQTLKHMVDDKINKRATGPITELMRCPTEGRAKAGGVKTGTMEKDVLAAGDAPEILFDRMCLSSDKFETTVCKHCGIIESHKREIFKCKACQKEDAMVSVTMSYSPKVVFQELMAIGIVPRLLVEKK